MSRPLVRHVTNVSYMNILIRTVKNTRDGEQTTFKGSAPAMEPEGVDRIFKRSVERHNFQYTEYYGDGNSKIFT